ncbi:hypothetical protein Cni_G09225 [Canna indica]|uniref:Secreted protein n=1 Tax=Canna indica TaxID=4628 RepID=A0AAQ3K598_9LILI|nr:hypothetical protein Cni_G09225 [Canna indica]
MGFTFFSPSQCCHLLLLLLRRRRHRHCLLLLLLGPYEILVTADADPAIRPLASPTPSAPTISSTRAPFACLSRTTTSSAPSRWPKTMEL